jgi:hypothetical protein
MRNENDIDVHIHQLEERIAARRARLGHDVDAVGTATRSLIASPGVLSAAAGLGFFLARATSRRRAPPKSRKASGLFGLLSGVGMTFLKMRYGSPAAWVGRVMAGSGRHGGAPR